MDDQLNCFLDWPLYPQAKSTEELTQTLLLTTMELEAVRVRAQEELKIRDEQLTQLKHILIRAISERDEAQHKCQTLLLEKLLLQQHHHFQTTPQSGISSLEERGLDSNNNGGFSSSDCEESIVSSPAMENPDQEYTTLVPATKALPEKGKLLEAVMKAGPLLQNLLLAGPLPMWRHPPPPLDTHQIPPPPVVVPPQPHQEERFGKKRGFSEGSDSSSETKYQRICSQLTTLVNPTTNTTAIQ